MFRRLIHDELATALGHEMLKKFAFVAVHAVFLAGVLVIAAYWSIRIFTPAPTSAPPPLPPPPLRDPDPVAAARMFGKVDVVQSVASNVQALGVFAAGKDSSAVLVVDGKPARVFLIGQEVAPGMKLVSVTADLAILESNGSRQEVRLPARPVAQLGGMAPPPNFTREGNTLTAPSSDGAPNIPRPPPMPRPAVPQPPPAVAPQPAPAQVAPPQPGQFGAQPQISPQQVPQPQPIVPGGVVPQSN
jgi:general secretion pathway protein C